MLLKLINPLFRDKLPPKTGFSNDPLKSIFESIKKLKLSDFIVRIILTRQKLILKQIDLL